MISVCIKDNHSSIQTYLMDKISNLSIPNIYYSKHNFRLYKNVIVHYLGKDINNFYNSLSNIISETIMKFYEPKIVKRLISSEYFYFDKRDKKAIYDEYFTTSRKCDEILSLDINNYIKDNKSIILDGFINFRSRNYISNIDNLLENAVSKFVLNKEYLEFVSLLRLYVDSKIPEPIKINLIYVNNESILLDENENLLEMEDFSSEYISDISFSQNDYALNTLIGKLPQKIYLHLISPKDEFINTLQLIFGDKIKICDGCEICSAYKLLNLK